MGLYVGSCSGASRCSLGLRCGGVAFAGEFLYKDCLFSCPANALCVRVFHHTRTCEHGGKQGLVLVVWCSCGAETATHTTRKECDFIFLCVCFPRGCARVLGHWVLCVYRMHVLYRVSGFVVNLRGGGGGGEGGEMLARTP